MRKLQLSLLRFKVAAFPPTFWTESILPECREVLRSVILRAKRAGLFFLLIYYFYPKAFKKSENLGILLYIENIVSFGVLDGEDFLRHFGSI